MAEAAEPSFDEICERLAIPEALRKHVASTAPRQGKLMVARGMLPAPAKALLAMQYVLLGEADEEIAKEASDAITGLEERRLQQLIDRNTHPKILEFVAYHRPDDLRLLEQIALLHQASDKTLCYLAETGGERICEIIAGNQERLIITPQLYHFLGRNPNCSRALLDRVKSFHRLYDIVLPELDVVEAEHAKKVAEQAEIAKAAEAAAKQAVAQPAAQPPPATAPPPAAEPEPAPQTPAAFTEPPPAAAAQDWDDGEPVEWQPPEPGELPSDFVPGEVYIPAAPVEQYVAPPGLLNPLAALLADWGIADSPDFVAPPDGIPTNGGGTPQVALTVDANSLTVDGAVELGAIGGTEADDADLTGGVSLAGSDFKFDFREDTTDFRAEFIDEDMADDDSVKEGIHKQVAKMTGGQKIKLAYKGNKTVRELLVRDSNKLVGVAVVKSGRITDQEVMTIAMNRAINEDVVRALSENKEYMRKYPIKVALVNNPKTPIPTAIGLVNSLHIKDLKNLANNRNVSSAVFSFAMKLYKARKQTMR